MNCTNCGAPLPQGAGYCPTCGTLTPAYYSSAGAAPDAPTVASSPAGAPTPLPPTDYGRPPYGVAPPSPYSAPLATPYAPYNAPPLTPPPPPPERRGNRIALLIGAALLALIVVVGGVVVLLRPGTRGSSSPTVPTLSPAQVTATAQAHATATASAIVALQNPYTHSGTLALSDPLRDNSKGYGWSEDAPNCAFINGTYHAIAPDARYSDFCLTQATTFSDFAFEAQMQIIKGDAGGLAFRVTRYPTTTNFYAFYIGQDGSYYLNLQNATGFPILTKGSNPAIHRGLNQTNLIAVVAQGSTIILYVNHQLITKVTDSTYTSGQLGVLVTPYNLPSEVVFSNVKVWRL